MSKRILLLLAGLLLAGAAVFGQVTNARIIGTVTDTEGNPLPGVSVEATSPKLVGKGTTISDEKGVYRLLNLMPGVYKIKFELNGFQTTVRENIGVALEQTITLNASLPLGKIMESIVVTGHVPLIDIKNTSKDLTMTKVMFSALPKGRDFASLVTVLPGVSTEAFAGGVDREGASKRAGGVSVDGATASENVFFVDGVNTTELEDGTMSQKVNFDFLDEIQVKAGGYQAEFGGSMGGVVNVITRSGGNELHGDLLGYYSGSALNGKQRDSLRIHPLNNHVAEYVNYQDQNGKEKETILEGGFSLGGYVFKDRLWFFGTLMPTQRARTRPVTFVSNGAKGDFDRRDLELNYSAKITAQPFSNLRVSASFLNNFWRYRGSLPTNDGAGDPGTPYGKVGFDYPNWSASLSADYTVGNNLMINARGGFFFSNNNNQQLQPSEPLWLHRQTNAGYAEIPADLVRARNWMNYSQVADGYVTKKDIRDRASFNLDVTYFPDFAGTHSLKAGIQWIRLHEDVDNSFGYPYVRLNWGQTYTDPADPTKQYKGTYGYYEVRNGVSSPFGTVAEAHSTSVALYIQDSWTIADRLTLNFGLRAESEYVPSFSDLPEYKGKKAIDFGFGDKLAPRLGFVYDVLGDSSLKVFGSYGVYYDVFKLGMAIGSYGGFKWISDYYTLDTYDWKRIGVNGYYPGTYIRAKNEREPAFDLTDPDLKPVAQSEVSFGAEKKLGENLSASVRLVYKHLIRAIEDIGFEESEGTVYYTANPGFGWTRYEKDGGRFPNELWACPKAKREYYAVNVSLDKRFSENWMAGFSFTWSSLRGNYSGLASSDEVDVNGYGRTDPNVARFWDSWFLPYTQAGVPIDGPLGTDRPLYFKAYGSYTFPFGLTVGLMANAYSGVPTSVEITLGGMQGVYPLGRGTEGRSPFIFTSNLYAEYAIRLGRTRLTLSLNVDNLTNNGAAQRLFALYNQDDPALTQEEILAHYDYKTVVGDLDPRFLKEYLFLNPISARFGLKFGF
jgi:hypothetical protein